MSDHIPVEIQLEIMARLPVKPLIRFRSVSKTWKSLIDSSTFIIKHYSRHHTQVHHLLVKYDYPLVGNDDEYDDCEEKYVSIVDDHTFPKQKVFLTLPPLVKNLICPIIIGGSHGLVGFYSIGSREDRRTDVFVLWNISIRKSVDVFVPNVRGGIYGTAIGFGVCRETNDLKIVKITYLDYHKTKGIESFIPEVEVFTLSTRAWRSYGNLPRKSIQFCLYDQVAIDGVLYWLAQDMITIFRVKRNMIISFDITSEEFKEVTLPDSLAHMCLNMSKLGESLVVVGQDRHAISSGYEVWMMGDGVPKLFMKLLTFTPTEDSMFNAYRQSGEPILDVPDEGEDDCGQLVVYEPYSKCIDSLGIDGFSGQFEVYNYTETLFLNDQPNLVVYNDMNVES